MNNSKNLMMAGLLALIVAPTVGALAMPDAFGAGAVGPEATDLSQTSAAAGHTVRVTCATTWAEAEASGSGASASASVEDETYNTGSGGEGYAYFYAEGEGPGSSAAASTDKLWAKCTIRGGGDCADTPADRKFRIDAAAAEGTMPALVSGSVVFSPAYGDFVLVGERTTAAGTESVTLGAVDGVFSQESNAVEIGQVDVTCAPLALYLVGVNGVEL